MRTKEEIELILKALYNGLATKNALGISVTFTRLRNIGYSEQDINDMLKARYKIKTVPKKKKKKGKK